MDAETALLLLVCLLLLASLRLEWGAIRAAREADNTRT